MKTETTLSGQWQRAAGNDPLGLRCVMSPDRAQVDVFTAVDRPLVVGRDPGEHRLVLADSRVSGTHAIVYPDASGLAFRDSGSKNGTSHNGARVDGGTLVDNDVLRVGNTFFVVTRLAPDIVFDEAPLYNLVGQSPRFREACARVERAAATDFPILLLGATGSGKEGLAHLAHRRSGRKGAIIATNCATLGGDMANAALFGHEKGAFTGASTEKKGLFRAAHDGTLFLDELGELPLDVQARLLRALEQKEIVPVGATTPVKVDVRIVAATNVDLEEAVKSGSFRADLYARLNAWPVAVPLLRERREDIVRLARHLAGPEHFDLLEPAAAEVALIHEWPFNIRELRTLVNLFIIEGGIPLTVEQLPQALRKPRPPRAPLKRDTMPERQVPAAVKGLRPRPPRDELVAVLERLDWNVTEVAKELGRDRKQIYRWIDQYGLTPPK